MAEEPTLEELIEGLRILQVQRREERARARAQHVEGSRLPNNRLPIGHRVRITNGVRLVGQLVPTGVIRWH